MIRKQIFIVTQMFLLDYPKVQAYLNAIVTGIVLFYLALKLPFNTNFLNTSFIIGESCLFIVFSASIAFVYIENIYSIDLVKEFCIYIIYICVGLQLMVSFFATLVELKLLFVKFLNRKRKHISIIKITDMRKE